MAFVVSPATGTQTKTTGDTRKSILNGINCRSYSNIFIVVAGGDVMMLVLVLVPVIEPDITWG